MTPLSREQVRAVDRLAIEELGIPGVVLMENAGRNAVEIIQKYMHDRGAALTSALIFCGGGNNGGDGYVIARHLHNRGVDVTIFAHKPVNELTPDAAIHARTCQKMNLPIHPTARRGALPRRGAPLRRGVLQHAGPNLPAPDLIIDALLGTGFTGDLRPDILELIQHINAQREQPDPQSPVPVIAAIDLPSGLDCDTGNPAQAAIRADLTVTFVAPKLGFTQPAAQPYLGHVKVADIGTPPELIQRVRGM